MLQPPDVPRKPEKGGSNPPSGQPLERIRYFFFAVDFLAAVDLFAADFVFVAAPFLAAVDLFAADFAFVAAPFLAAVDLFAADCLAVDFLAVDFFATGISHLLPTRS